MQTLVTLIQNSKIFFSRMFLLLLHFFVLISMNNIQHCYFTISFTWSEPIQIVPLICNVCTCASYLNSIHSNVSEARFIIGKSISNSSLFISLICILFNLNPNYKSRIALTLTYYGNDNKWGPLLPDARARCSS